MLAEKNVKKNELHIKCGILVEKEDKLLLQRNPGESFWSLPGAMLHVGEKYEEAARRGLLKDTALSVESMELFGMISGRDCFVTTKFGEKAFVLQVYFRSTEYTGKVRIVDDSKREHRFYKRTNLPKNVNPQQKKLIYAWKEESSFPIID